MFEFFSQKLRGGYNPPPEMLRGGYYLPYPPLYTPLYIYIYIQYFLFVKVKSTLSKTCAEQKDNFYFMYKLSFCPVLKYTLSCGTDRYIDRQKVSHI